MICLEMMATLVANFPDKSVRFLAILGLFTPILITFFPWQILQKNIILGFLEFWFLLCSWLLFWVDFKNREAKCWASKKYQILLWQCILFCITSFPVEWFLLDWLMRQNTIAATKKFIIISIISACSFLEKRGFSLRKIWQNIFFTLK